MSDLLYSTIDFFTTGAISVLHNRFLYYNERFLYSTIDFFTETISVLQERFLYYRPQYDFFTTGAISVLHNRFLYYTDRFLYSTIRFLYYKIDFCTPQSISLLQERCCTPQYNSLTTRAISVLHNSVFYYRNDFRTPQ